MFLEALFYEVFYRTRKHHCCSPTHILTTAVLKTSQFKAQTTPGSRIKSVPTTVDIFSPHFGRSSHNLTLPRFPPSNVKHNSLEKQNACLIFMKLFWACCTCEFNTASWLIRKTQSSTLFQPRHLASPLATGLQLNMGRSSNPNRPEHIRNFIRQNCF